MKTPDRTSLLLHGETYHIYNKAVGNELLFRTEKDYYFFLNKYERFILPYTEIYSYCLIPNHFHFLLRIKNLDEINKPCDIDRAFANFFISYSRSYNNAHKRLGRLFCQPYKRIVVEDEDYLRTLVCYIHRNPIHHGYSDTYKDWKYSSFSAFQSGKKTKVTTKKVIDYFYSNSDFLEFHDDNKEFNIEDKYLLE